jgi:anti-sigma regulatory factor (Ser/Thr protein kinase)
MIAGKRAEMVVEPTASAPRTARTFLDDTLQGWAVNSARRSDLVLVASELVANAVQHGDGSTVVVQVGVDDDSIELVVDAGVESPDTVTSTIQRYLDTSTPPAQPRGRGLGIVRTLTDEVRIDVAGARLRVAVRARRT